MIESAGAGGLRESDGGGGQVKKVIAQATEAELALE